MNSSDPASPPPLDTRLEGLMEWDNPFRQGFVAGSSWAPWLASGGFPPKGGDAEYEQYRRDYAARLDEAYAQWKRSGVP